MDATLLALKPATLDMRQAAALPLVSITAWEGLVDRARLQAGQRRVLVHGGAGGVGHVAVQIAKALGAQVFATGSAADQATIRSLGATPIDYRAQTLEQYVAEHTAGQGFDVVYDTVGGATLDASFVAVRRFGQVVSCLGWGTHALAPLSFRAASYSGVFTLLPLGLTTNQITLSVVILSALGFILPSFYIQRRQGKMKAQYRSGFPDFMDLLVVCVEAGLSLQPAIARISREMAGTTPQLAANLHLVGLELRAGSSLGDALDSLTQRLDLEEAYSLASLLKQSEELGTSLSAALLPGGKLVKLQ